MVDKLILKVVEPNKDLWESAVEFAKEVKNLPTEFDIYASNHLIEKCKHGLGEYVPNQTLWIMKELSEYLTYDFNLMKNL